MFQLKKRMILDWEILFLTMLGRITDVTSLIISNLTSVVAISKLYINDFKKNYIKLYIWNNKQEMVKRSTLTKDHTNLLNVLHIS